MANSGVRKFMFAVVGGGGITLNYEYGQGRTLSIVVQYSRWIKQFLTWKEANGSGVKYIPRKREGRPEICLNILYIFINEFKPLIMIIRGVH